MQFQFMCPHGHLLQGDIAQMGMPCQCPHCGITFIIPQVPQYMQAPAPSPYAPYQDPYAQPAAQHPYAGGIPDFRNEPS